MSQKCPNFEEMGHLIAVNKKVAWNRMCFHELNAQNETALPFSAALSRDPKTICFLLKTSILILLYNACIVKNIMYAT